MSYDPNHPGVKYSGVMPCGWEDSQSKHHMMRIDSSGRIYAAGLITDTLGNVTGYKMVDGKPRFSSMPYLYDVAEGNVINHSAWNKYAINDDVDSSAEEDIWSVGGSYSWPSAATLMAAVSSSVEDDPAKADTNAGTGIWSVRVYYLTTTFVEKTEDVTLNGTAEVNLAATDIYRINRIRPLTTGTGLKAAGNIDIKARAPASTIYSRIATGFTKGRQLVYTVPTGKSLYITRITGSIGGTTAPKFGRFTLRSTWDDVSLTRNAWMTAYAETGQSSGFFTIPLEAPLVFPAGSDLVMSCKSLDDNCFVTGSLRGWLESD